MTRIWKTRFFNRKTKFLNRNYFAGSSIGNRSTVYTKVVQRASGQARLHTDISLPTIFIRTTVSDKIIDIENLGVFYGKTKFFNAQRQIIRKTWFINWKTKFFDLVGEKLGLGLSFEKPRLSIWKTKIFSFRGKSWFFNRKTKFIKM